MNVNDLTALSAAFKKLHILHTRFEEVSSILFSQLLMLEEGELIILIGPPRAGKSRLIKRAMRQITGYDGRTMDRQPYVYIVAENSQATGEFSTRAFMLSACEAIRHPIYGSTPTDPEMARLLEIRKHRTAEGMFRDAFETSLPQLQTLYVVIDEAHHVRYARGGDKAAVKILDSWKCLAAKTKTRLVLVGSYELLELLERVPHLIGRGSIVELSRYKQTSRTDIESFEQALMSFSHLLPFESPSISLRNWNRLLFEQSFGCIGHLSKILRRAVATMSSSGARFMSEDCIRKAVYSAREYAALKKDIENGEILMASMPSYDNLQGGKRKVEGRSISTSSSKGRRRPFQRHSMRSARGGRV